ncbi:MAG: hypothetical protein D6685_07815 [Bacteroidetes bacterium]|nr:MAG: hypothetical protein D6685_07815 [Bacteroidota bacterium]
MNTFQNRRPTGRLAACLLALLLAILPASSLQAQFADAWQVVVPHADAHKRHEAAFIQVGNKYYLLGGRGIQPVDVYDPAARRWSRGAAPPVELHHFQAVTYHGLILVAGALVGPWPYEVPASHVYLYDPVEDRWIVGPEIPVHRRRGAAGAVLHGDTLYLVGGIVNGHTSHWVPWLDALDLRTNTWRELPDAPRPRDHFQAAVVDGKLYAVAGRWSGYTENGFASTVAEVDVYDLATETWTTLPPSGHLPTRRAGNTVAVVGDEILVIGGESDTQVEAHAEVEALNVRTGTWRALPPLLTGRHGTQVIANAQGLFIAGGCAQRGGHPEIVAFEHLALAEAVADAAIGRPVTPGTLVLRSTRPTGDGGVQVTLANEGGNQALVLAHALVTGGGTVEAPYGFPYLLPPGATQELTARPDGDGAASLLVKAWQSGPPVVVPLGE